MNKRIKSLLSELKRLVADLSNDLLTRVKEHEEINAGLKNAFEQIKAAGRTAQAFEVWRRDYLDQVAVAWVLSCVFVRFIEDNGLTNECWLAGEGERRQRAEDNLSLFFRENPNDEYRDYFLHVFKTVGQIPACVDLFAAGKTPLWAVGPSGDAAMKLLAFWREIDTDTGRLKRTFEFEDSNTRFLGDLYQDLSALAKKKYALLQTPEFVEEFILDRTLEPALSEFGLEGFRIIDPTCGSGHFLLGAFERLFDRWMKRESNEIVAAQKALDAVWGVDINPFAVAIARFRLMVAAINACKIKVLSGAPAWSIHLATGDSLLFGRRWFRDGSQRDEARFLDDSWAPEIYACDDKDAINEVLGQQYHAVVGNPPYITPKDSACRQAYRDKYLTAHDKYHLSTPFTERFFELAISSDGGSCGYVGLIKDNAFMRRVFGKKLIEEYLAKVDLTHVVNTEGAYIPGHGTPTVILFGRHRNPMGQTIRAVYGIKGEPETPADPAKGLVWNSILRNIDNPDSEDAYTSSTDVSREVFAKHPWSTSGGGASELFSEMQTSASEKLNDRVSSVGIVCFTLEDDVFVMPRHLAEMHEIPAEELREMVEGDSVRDWSVGENDLVLFPYDQRFRPIKEFRSSLFKYLWKYRSRLANNKMFNGKAKVETGLRWYEYGRLTHHKLSTPLSIVVAEIATHNHFVLDRGGRLFKQTAPIVKLHDDASEREHYALLSILNSSAAGFWLKQGAHNKGDSTDQHGARTTGDPAFNTFVFNSKHVEKLPLPKEMFPDIAREIDELSQSLCAASPSHCSIGTKPTIRSLEEKRVLWEKVVPKMVFLQEELDWKVYKAYDLLEEDLSYHGDDQSTLELGQRAFEIVLADNLAAGKTESDWFRRHNRKQPNGIPSEFTDDYREIVKRRIEAIRKIKPIRLIERPEFKRRWQIETWQSIVAKYLREWLLERLTQPPYFGKGPKYELQSIATISDQARADTFFQEVAAIYRGRNDFETSDLVRELVESESVPLLPQCLYKKDGFSKRSMWERAWELQRQEDADGNSRVIEYPKDYAAEDFQNAAHYRLRGKLDVPKERFVSFPNCERDSDSTLVVGWAGWDHIQHATAVVAYYDARKREGWSAERLMPLLAALDQLLPWIHQWHPEIDPEYNETAGTSFQTLLESEAQELGLTLEQIRKWTPPAGKKAAKKKAEGGSKPRTTRKKKTAEESEAEE